LIDMATVTRTFLVNDLDGSTDDPQKHPGRLRRRPLTPVPYLPLKRFA